MATRVTSSRFVGRTAELAELEAALADVVARERPSLAFVAGESGVGKTRLLIELERRAEEHHGALVIGGDCVELGEGELPYAPIVSALRGLARRDDPVLGALAAAARRELAALVPALAPDGETALAAEESDQTRLFEALLALLEALAANRPVVLSIEDLHWADRSTRAFLAFLSANLCGVPIMVISTYRPDELHRRHPLRPLLAELERDRRSLRVDVSTLSRDELGEQLADILGAPPSPALLERLWTRSEGNPLFTEELLAAGLDGRGDVPPNLRDALMLRVERLGEPTQELLRLIAAGRRLGHTVLADASGMDAPALRDALREAVANHILVADADGEYAFRHALLREVVHDDLLPGEHAELHLTLARALERRALEEGDGAHLAAGVAHHYSSAGDQPAALAASVRAGLAAQRVHAYGEAAALFERALELWDRVPGADELAAHDRVEVLALAATAHDNEGDSVRAETLLHRALELVDERTEPVRVASLLERLQRAEWGLNRQAESIATADRALALLDPSQPTPERATLLSSKAKSLMLQSRYNQAVGLAREALEVAEAAGDARSAGRALNALGVSLMGLGEFDEGIAHLRRALAVAQEVDRPHDVSSAYTNLADSLNLWGRTREAIEVAREGLEASRTIGRASSWLGFALSEFLMDAGEWEEAAALLPDAPQRRFVGTLDINHSLRRAELALGHGDHETAREVLDGTDRLAVTSREPQFLGVLGALRAELERRSGDLRAAREAVETALDRIEFCSEDVMRVARVSTTGVKVEADAAQQARDLGDPDAEHAAIDRALALLDRVRAAAADERPVETAFLRSAEAEDARARGIDHPELWAAATAAWDALERPYLAAQTRWREAEAHVARGDREAAAVVADAALTQARKLGAGWLAGELEGLAARARLRLDAAAQAAAAGRAVEPATPDADDPFGLTPRERQVLALLAQGATNREIGARLYMAEKTASVHVSRILSKLDVRSRTQAAAVAHRHGLESE